MVAGGEFLHLLVLHRQRPDGPLVAVEPDQPIIPGGQDGIARLLCRADGARAELVGGREGGLAVSPDFEVGLDPHRFGAVGFEADDGMVGVHPEIHRDQVLPLAHTYLDPSLPQMQCLHEGRAVRQRVGCELHTYSPELERTADLTPGVRLGDVEQQVATGLDPDVQADVAIAQRHRAHGILAGGVPDDVVLVNRSGRVRKAPKGAPGRCNNRSQGHHSQKCTNTTDIKRLIGFLLSDSKTGSPLLQHYLEHRQGTGLPSHAAKPCQSQRNQSNHWILLIATVYFPVPQ